MAAILRTAAGVGAGLVVGYCMPKLEVLTPFAEPVEKALAALPFPKPKLELTYFDIMGVAEKVRLTCVVGGLKFEDKRVKFDDWPALNMTTKFGQLPLLSVDGEVFAQSNAMITYVGKLTGMYPSDPKKALAVDQVIGLHEDVMGKIRPSILIMRDTTLLKKEALNKQTEMRRELAVTSLPAMFSLYEQLLTDSSTGFFVGSSATVADIAVFAQLKFITSGFLDGIPPTIVDNFPKLSAHYARVGQMPAIQKWYEAEKK